MKRLLVLAVVLAPAVAHADRKTIVNIGGNVGLMGSTDTITPGAIGGPRLTLAWEDPQLAIPDEKGTFDLGVALVPELFAGSLFESDRAEAYLGVGVRGELKIAQNSMGLLEVTARGAAYISARALVVGDTRDATYAFGFGQYFSRLKNETRFGYEAEFLDRPHYEQSSTTYVGFLFSLYVGWAP